MRRGSRTCSILQSRLSCWYLEMESGIQARPIVAAGAKEVRIKPLMSRGARQYCEFRPRDFRVVKKKSFDRPRSWLDLRVVGVDGRQYAITLWKTDGPDQETRLLIESQFGR